MEERGGGTTGHGGGVTGLGQGEVAASAEGTAAALGRAFDNMLFMHVIT